MHPFDDSLPNDENLRLCAERVRIMHAIADRVDGTGFMVQRTAGEEPGMAGMLNPTIKIHFETYVVFELRGEAELVRTVIDLASEISDLFVQFQQRHEAMENLCRHVVNAKNMVTKEWLSEAAALVNNCMDASSVDGNLHGSFALLGDRIVWIKSPKSVIAV